MVKEFQGKTYSALLRYRLRIPTRRMDYRTGQLLQTLIDEYMIEKYSKGQFKLLNNRTGHYHFVHENSIRAFLPDLNDSPSGLKYGNLVLHDQLWQSGNHAWIKARC